MHLAGHGRRPGKTILHNAPPNSCSIRKIYHSEAPGHHRWNKRSCGVAAFVKDNPRRSYYVRVFDMDRRMMVFEQETYNQFRYKTPKPYFHTFEGDECQVSLGPPYWLALTS